MKVFATLVVVALATRQSSAQSDLSGGLMDFAADVEPTHILESESGLYEGGHHEIPQHENTQHENTHHEEAGPEKIETAHPGGADPEERFIEPHNGEHEMPEGWQYIEEAGESDTVEGFMIPEAQQFVEGCDGAEQCSTYENAVQCHVVDTCLSNFYMRRQDSSHWDSEVMDGSCQDVRYACYSRTQMEDCDTFVECFIEYNERFENENAKTVNTHGMENYREEFEVIESTGEIVYGVVDYTTVTATMVFTLPSNSISSPARECYETYGTEAVYLSDNCCETGAFTDMGECDRIPNPIANATRTLVSNIRCTPNNVYVNGACVAYECPETPGCNDPEPYCYYDTQHGMVLGVCSN